MTGKHDIRVIARPSTTAPQGAVEVGLSGEFDIATEAHLADCLFEVVRIASQVHVDITNVSFLDAATVRILVAACARVRSLGGTFSVTIDAGHVRHVFELLDVLDYLEADSRPYPFGEPPVLIKNA